MVSVFGGALNAGRHISGGTRRGAVDAPWIVVGGTRCDEAKDFAWCLACGRARNAAPREGFASGVSLGLTYFRCHYAEDSLVAK